MKHSRLAIAIVSSAVIVSMNSAPARAGVNSADSCATSQYYSTWGASTYLVPAKELSIFRDGPGGTITVTLTKNYTSSATASGATSAEANGIFASARIEISASLTTSTSLEVSHTYSHNITAGRYGNAQYGSWGKRFFWGHYQDTPQCTTIKLSGGTAYMPTRSVGWNYWEN